jgi:hypothetical protein
MIRNKKGDITIVIFVIMVVALSGAVLVMMLLEDRNVKNELKTPEEVSNLYSEEELLNYHIRNILEEAVVRTYETAAKSGEYISNSPDCFYKGQKFFCTINPGLKSYLQQNIQTRLLQNLNFTEFIEDLNEKGMLLDISLKNYEFVYSDKVKFSLKNITFIYDSEKKTGIKDVIIRHSFNISQETNFDEIGLDDFNTIYEKIISCKNANFKECFKLKHFNTIIEDTKIENKDFYNIRLSSKEEHSIDKESRKVEFSFLVEK